MHVCEVFNVVGSGARLRRRSRSAGSLFSISFLLSANESP